MYIFLATNDAASNPAANCRGSTLSTESAKSKSASSNEIHVGLVKVKYKTSQNIILYITKNIYFIGMTLPMQQNGMPVVSMNQGMSVGSLPQSISMVQQLPVSIQIYFVIIFKENHWLIF